MLFAFAEPDTLRIDYKALLGADGRFPLEYLQTLNEARQRVCDALAAQPSSQAVVDAIQGYLPHILRLVEISEKEALKIEPFGWKSVLSRGVITSLKDKLSKKVVVKCPSLYYEVISVFLAYCVALCNMAGKKVTQTPANASEAALNEAIDMYCRASGIALMVSNTWATRWSGPTAKERPVETSPLGFQVIAEFCLVEAQILALTKAEQRGLSVPTLVKLQRNCLDRLEAIQRLLKSDKKVSEEWSDLFARYIADGRLVMEGLMLKRYATHAHGEDRNGVAVACMTKAYNILVVDARRVECPVWSKVLAVAMKDSDIKAVLENIVRINNNVTYERVPSNDEILEMLPVATSLVGAKPFELPPLAEGFQPVEEEAPAQDTQQAKGSSKEPTVRGAIQSLFKITPPKD